MKKGIIKICALCLLGAGLCAVILRSPKGEAPGEYIYAGSEQERESLLIGEGVGQFKLISAQDIVIPVKDSGIYGKYIALQKLQGLPLEYLRGEEAILYTYETSSFNSNQNSRIELMVCEDRLVAAGVYEYLSGSEYVPLFRQNFLKND